MVRLGPPADVIAPPTIPLPSRVTVLSVPPLFQFLTVKVTSLPLMALTDPSNANSRLGNVLRLYLSTQLPDRVQQRLRRGPVAPSSVRYEEQAEAHPSRLTRRR